ncbi:MAG: hypothetical protein R3E79_04415 [Caldilineaceae bacterium]
MTIKLSDASPTEQTKTSPSPAGRNGMATATVNSETVNQFSASLPYCPTVH